MSVLRRSTSSWYSTEHPQWGRKLLEALPPGETKQALLRCHRGGTCKNYRLCKLCAENRANEEIGALLPALDRRQLVRGYQLQALTLTRATPSDVRCDAMRYISLLKDTFGILARELKRGFLQAPGFGASVFAHLSDNVHLHMVYWGPPVTDLSRCWYEATKDSTNTRRQSLSTRRDISSWVAYCRRIPAGINPEALVSRTQAMGRMKTKRSSGFLWRLQ